MLSTTLKFWITTVTINKINDQLFLLSTTDTQTGHDLRAQILNGASLKNHFPSEFSEDRLQNIINTLQSPKQAKEKASQSLKLANKATKQANTRDNAQKLIKACFKRFNEVRSLQAKINKASEEILLNVGVAR